MSETQRASVVMDLLLGAAHADGALDGREADKVRELLGTLSSDADLLAQADARIQQFDPKTFDVAATAAAFTQDSDEQKRRLLELVAQIHDADDELDLAEDSFLRELGQALGLEESAYEDLVLSYTVEEQQGLFNDVVDVEID